MQKIRITKTLDHHWRFFKGDPTNAAQPDFDDTEWLQVRIPHDWAITGPFHKEHDIQCVIKKQAGIEDIVTELTGCTGGLPHIGIGWYRLTFSLPEKISEKYVRLEFDGIMSQSTIYCNGKEVGGWPYGYSSFNVNISDTVQAGDNVIAVRVDNPQHSSRWYPGAGIYRNVRLIICNKTHIARWGTAINTPEVSHEQAYVHVNTTLIRENTADIVTARFHILNADDAIVAKSEQCIHPDKKRQITFDTKLVVTTPQLWSPDSPKLYRLLTEILIKNVIIDESIEYFGIRSLTFDPVMGFLLNGQALKIKGVCLHHDLGPLGAAVNTAAIKRQLTMLKKMGSNAIRTSHNPPAPELLDLTDKMGFLVIDEAFDEWREGKMENGYHKHFDRWAEKDLRAMIKRDRNHPSVILWSIGNEVQEQRAEGGEKTCQYLVNICRDEDPSRLTTAGFNFPWAAIKNGLVESVDIPGWNYVPQDYMKLHTALPHKAMVASETASTISTRGEYYFPVNEEISLKRDTLQVNSYDMSFPQWAYSPDVEFYAQDQCAFMMGEFVWTGFDYLGEPTPYLTEWPSRSSYFGIIDICGIPKDRFYSYQSRWSNTPVLHLIPHWTWPGREGHCIPVHCYTNHPRVELLLNGQSLGRRSKRSKALTEKYRLTWPDVPYEPGELKAIAYDNDSKIIARCTVYTAESAADMALSIDKDHIQADGDDMAFVIITIVDEHQHHCPQANNLIEFEIHGPADIVALCNGDPTSLQPFQATHIKAFNGKCAVYLRSNKETGGEIILRANSEGLKSQELHLYSS